MIYQAQFEESIFFHVFNHGIGSENLFRNDENFRYFLKKYSQHTDSILETYAYCLMPNHFHFLVKIKPIEILAQLPKFSGDVHVFVMQKLSNFLNAYAKAYNVSYKRRGALFLNITKRIAVTDDNYFTTLIYYIHNNPVKHGFCRKIEDWEYSSYHAFLSENISKIKKQEVLDWFGGKTAFEEFHLTPKNL